MDQDKLHILWTSQDPLNARLMVMMYAKNSLKNGWWKEVTVIVWGAAVKLLAEDPEVQREMAACKASGVEFEGCIACAKEQNLEEQMETLGVKLRKWGPPLTELLKSGKPLITV